MIIDFHRHVFRLTDAELPAQAARQVREGVTHGIQVTVDEVVAGVRPMHRDYSGELMIRHMDEAGIDVSVNFMIDNPAKIPDDETALAENKAVADLAKRYPGRMVYFASIDPRRAKAPQLLERCIEEFGARGLKVHPGRGYEITGPEVYKLFEVAQKRKIVVLTHTGPTAPPRRNRLAHPMLLDDVSVDFPDLKIVGAHTGLYWFRDWAAIAALNDNIYGDLAVWQLDAVGRYDRFCRNLRELLDSAGSDRIMLGTDYPAFEPLVSSREFVRIIKALPQEAAPGTHFSQAEIDAILGGNAKRLLGL